MNDTTKKTKHRFNIIDVLIIIGIIAAAVFSVKILTGDLFGDKIVNVQYTVKLEGVRANSDLHIEEGSRVYSTDINIPVGVINSVRKENAVVYEYSPSYDRYYGQFNEDIWTVYLDITAGCVFRNGAYFTEAMRISENTSIDINVPFAYDSAEIIKVIPNTMKEAE